MLEGSLFSLPLVVADAKSLLPNETAALAPSLSIDKVLGALVPLEYEVEQILLVPNVTATISTIVDETPKAVILAFALLKAFQGIAFASTISVSRNSQAIIILVTHADDRKLTQIGGTRIAKI